ncbi:hypothetical protein ACQUWM_16240 [Marinobacter sp. DUT-3]|uniref:hypothetical protein n=1 Tax=Marinobacter sp. DUT-3 TaxID=3412036 RepID=UPI003D16ACFB
MLLTKELIKYYGLVKEGVDDGYRSTTYDLRISKIIDSDGKEVSDDCYIESSGIVELISEEVVSLPNFVTAFAHVKTGLSSEGLLALNIGLIDPGWCGPLSTTLVNFGKHRKLLQKGDPFLRVTFIQSMPVEDCKTVAKLRYDYEKDKRKTFVTNFDRTFLGLETHIKNKVKQVSSSDFEKRIGIIALVFTTVFIVVQIGASYFLYSDPWDKSIKDYYYERLNDAHNSVEAHDLSLRVQRLEESFHDGASGEVGGVE